MRKSFLVPLILAVLFASPAWASINITSGLAVASADFGSDATFSDSSKFTESVFYSPANLSGNNHHSGYLHSHGWSYLNYFTYSSGQNANINVSGWAQTGHNGFGFGRGHATADVTFTLDSACKYTLNSSTTNGATINGIPLDTTSGIILPGSYTLHTEAVGLDPANPQSFNFALSLNTIKKNLVLITHGWNDQGATLGSFPVDHANSIIDQINARLARTNKTDKEEVLNNAPLRMHWSGGDIASFDTPDITSSKDRWDVVAFDWENAATNWNVVEVMDKAKALGQKLGEEIAKEQYDSIHLIGHSAGSWVIQGITNAIHEYDNNIENIASPHHTYIHETFLDPADPKDPNDIGDAARDLGTHADYAEVYTHNGNLVFTNTTSFDHAVNFDITHAFPIKEKSIPLLGNIPFGVGKMINLLATGDSSGHSWPVDWYQATIEQPNQYSVDVWVNTGSADNPHYQLFTVPAENKGFTNTREYRGSDPVKYAPGSVYSVGNPASAYETLYDPDISFSAPTADYSLASFQGNGTIDNQGYEVTLSSPSDPNGDDDGGGIILGLMPSLSSMSSNSDSSDTSTLTLSVPVTFSQSANTLRLMYYLSDPFLTSFDVYLDDTFILNIDDNIDFDYWSGLYYPWICLGSDFSPGDHIITFLFHTNDLYDVTLDLGNMDFALLPLTAVPEPASLTLLLAASTTALLRRRR